MLISKYYLTNNIVPFLNQLKKTNMKTSLVFFTVMLLLGSIQLLTGQMTENRKTINPFVFEDFSERNPLAIPEIGDSRMGFFKRMCNKTKFSMYQDIVIDYDMLTGKQNLYLRKVGSSDIADRVKYSDVRTVMKIKKNRSIYLHISNYNSNLYRVVNDSKNKEFLAC